jgi:DNA-directed RNA polymerase specialized sigma24 family protein
MPLSIAEVAAVYEQRYAGFRLGVAAILDDFDGAHDVVQEGFAQALADRMKCRGNAPEAWIWRIVERKTFAELHRRGRQAPEPDVAVDCLNGTGNPALLAAVKALAPRRRLVVFLRYMADLPYADIARICGTSEGTVAATLAQARAELAKSIEREGVHP